MSICYSKEVAEIECAMIAGVDRNLANIACGNHDRVIVFDVSQAVKIAENTRSVTGRSGATM